MSASFAVFESAGGAKIFRLPLQVFPNFWAYAYVVQYAGETYLIDAGSGTDASYDDLLNGLKQAHLSPSDLTHHDGLRTPISVAVCLNPRAVLASPGAFWRDATDAVIDVPAAPGHP